MRKLVCGFLCGFFAFLPAFSSIADDLVPSFPSMQKKNSATFLGERRAVSLEEAIALALRNNRQIQSAYIGRIAQKFDLEVAEDHFVPKASLNAKRVFGKNEREAYRGAELAPSLVATSPLGTKMSLSWAKNTRSGDLSPTHQSAGVTFSVIQPLLKDAGIDAAMTPVRLARLSEKRAKLALQKTLAQTISQVASAYRELLRSQDQLRIAKEATKRAEELLQMNHALIAAGRMAAQDILQTQASLATYELAEEEARNNQLTNTRFLQQLLGLSFQTPMEAADALVGQEVSIPLARAIALAFEHQPDYLQGRISLEEAQVNLAYAKNQRLWDVSLVGARTQRDDALLGQQMRQWDNYVGIQVAIPLNDKSAKQAEIQAKTQLKQQEMAEEELKVSLEREVTDAVLSLQTRWRQYVISQKALGLASQKLSVEREKLKVGRSSNFQVLSFETDLRNAQSQQLNALIAYFNAQTTLDEKLGMTLINWEIALNDE